MSNQGSRKERTGERVCGSNHKGVELDIRSNYQLLWENRIFIRAGHNRHAPG